MVSRYSGDPRPYIECGVVTVVIDGKPVQPLKQYSANKPEVRAAKTVGRRRFGLRREMKLDARLVVRVEPRGKGSRVYSNATFAAQKLITRLVKGGKPDALIHREVISFKSDETGQFRKGTVCVGTSKLENLPLSPFKKSS